MIGSDLADTLVGDAGNNVIEAKGGVDKMSGGPTGSDTLSYAHSSAGVTIDRIVNSWSADELLEWSQR